MFGNVEVLARVAFIGALAGCVLSNSAALGATIVEVSRPGCAIALSGPIEEGDHQKFLKLAEKIGLFEPSDSGEPSNKVDDALCLNSPGGSYIEGRLISQELRDHGIPTRVEAAADCFSSCAFIFMAGRLLGPESDATSRHLHIKGRLGFHAPYIVPDETKSYSASEVSARVVLTSKIIADFIKFGSDSSPYNGRPFFPVSLIAELLSASPEELALVDTVEDAARWQIDLYGMKSAAVWNENQMRQACANFLAWELDRQSEVINTDWPFPLSYKKGALDREPVVWAVINTGGMDVQECRVQKSAKPETGFTICSRDEGNGITRGSCEDGWGLWVPWYYGLSPRLPLASIPE
ncbi:hypothetical protein [Ensifer sp. MJa1]|uniref:COG3904 family protein n=1 Tax=Ensifer sp. MJa1 TaxID=2919888 RepID=UPI0030094914